MTLHRHLLRGCAPSPLAHYLKALAVLRIVHEQLDPNARGRWAPHGFELATNASVDNLVRFFLEEWSPTPFTDPWNGGSGYYPKDKAALSEGLAPLRECPHPRFIPYRAVLDAEWARTRRWDERPEDEAKRELQASCRATWHPAALPFLRAAFTPVSESAKDSVKYPALFGTGGNDGKLDLCANYMKRLWNVFSPEDGRALPTAGAALRASLFGDAVPALVAGAVGFLLPGGAGGANATDGFDGGAWVNPWDFLLMLEGGVVLAVATTRATNGELTHAAAPFAFGATAAGYGSACRSEESARGEQWFPEWSGWSSAPEVAALFREGRMALEERGSFRPSRRALDAVRAVRLRGAARGVAAFHRFAYVERNGQANLAVPLGRVATRDDPAVALLDDVADWVRAFRRAVPDDAPRGLVQTLARLESAWWDVCNDGGERRWRALVVALGAAEAAVIARPRLAPEHGLRPLPRLRAGWWDQLGAGPEVELAAAVTAAHDGGRAVLRTHLAPLDGARFAQSDERLRADPDVVWTGRDLEVDLRAVVRRRALAAEHAGFPMRSGTSLHPGAVAAFLARETDDAFLAGLIRGMSTAEPRAPAPRSGGTGLPGPFVVLRLATWPGPIDDEVRPPLDPRILTLLDAGRLADAVNVAASRLAGCGLRVRQGTGVGGIDDAHRALAALAFPISPSHARALVSRVRRTALRAADQPHSEPPHLTSQETP